MADLSSRTVARKYPLLTRLSSPKAKDFPHTELKEELQQKGVDVKGLKLKKDYIEKLQAVLDADSGDPSTDTARRRAQREEEDELDPSSDDEQGKHVSARKHDERIRDPETALSAPTAEGTENVKEAKDDPSVAITKEHKNEQILGDADGDLGEKMEAAAEAGKAERKEENGDTSGQPEAGMKAVEETKEEGNIAVEAAEAQPPQVAAQQMEQTDNPFAETTDVPMKKEPVQPEKRKRQDEESENDGKRARLSPAPERESQPGSPVTVASPKAKLKDKAAHPLPDKLSYVRHPATRALYISNLRRPLLLPDLKAWLVEQGSSDGDEEDVLDDEAFPGGVWLDGVKSHCYCVVCVDPCAIPPSLPRLSFHSSRLSKSLLPLPPEYKARSSRSTMA